MMIQTLEWTMMLFVILVQHKQSLGEIMYKFNNKASRDKFRKVEKAIFIIYLIYITLSIILRLYIIIAYKLYNKT